MEQFGFLAARIFSRFASTGLPVASRSNPCADGTPAGKKNGFTLLETLTALGILSIALASLFGAFSTGLRAVKTADQYVEALNLAQSLLAQRTAKWKQQVGTSQGTYGDLSWTVAVKPTRGPGNLVSGKNRWGLYQVTVRVSWRPNREITLQTLKLGERA